MNNSLKIRINLNKKKKGLKKIPLFLLFLLLFLDVGLMSFAATDSSDSNNTDEWRMDGRTLNGTRYYPGLILPNISQLEVRTYTTTGSTGDPTIADGFMYGIALRGSLYKLNASNISQRVNQSSNALFQYPVQALWNGFVYAADEYGNVYQYNSSNLGQTLATNTQPYPQHYSSPIVYQGYVYFTDWWTSGGPIYQANASNITQVITTSPRQGCDSAPVIANSFIYYGCGSTIYQLNATNISQQKAQYTAGGSMATGSTLTVTDNFLYFGTNDNKLYQLNASNVSQHIANFTTNGDISGGPAYAHGFVYIGSADGYTYQLNATNISQHIANFSTGAVYGSPIVTNNYLIVGGTSLYQLNAMNISQMITNYSLSLSDTSPTIVRGMLYVSAGYSFYQFGSEIPTVTLNSPTNISYFSQSIDSITFNCSAEDNLALTNISLYLTNFQNASFSFNQTTIVTGLTNITSWNLSLTRGNYTWNCLVYDADGNSKWGVNRTIYPDLSAPAIRVIYPTNNTNTSNTGLNINYTATDSYLSTCWYSNDSMSTNITLDNCANITTVIWGEGAHNLIIWANDSSNNINNSFVKFTIDTILPQINIVYPANNTNSSNNRLNINYTRSDANLASCWYSNDTMTKNTTLSTCANITAVIWTEGQHNLTVWANDSAGNKNNSLVSFYIDSLAPEINITYPSNNTNSINNGLNVNYTVSDLNLASCWYTNDSKTTNITIAGCSNLTSIIWGEGQHNVTIWANDTFGNKNNSFVVFTMDTLGPAFTAIANQSIDYDSALSYTIIASDSSGISCYRMNDTTNFNLNCNGDLKNNTLIPEGLYWLNITANDTLKNENYGLMYVNVSLNPQIKISVITPSGNINASQNQTFQVSVNVSCKYADCGGINVSLDPETNEINLQFENEGKKDEEGITTQTAISLYDNKTFEYDIQDGCSISDGMTDVFDGGLVLYINATSYTGLRSTTEDNGREAICNGQTLSGLNVSRKVYVPITGNFSRFLEVLHNPGTSTACAFIRLYQDMGSDGSDFMNTSDGNLTWELSDHWMIWDDTSVTAGDDVAGFIYQQDEAAEKVDKVTPTSASGGINQFNYSNICVDPGQTKIIMHFFVQFDTRPESIAEANAIYTAFSDAIHTSGMSATEISQVVNWVITSTAKGGLISTNTSATPFYSLTQNPYNITLSANQSTIVTWTVNATGAIGQNYTFFAYANRTANLSAGAVTSIWNVSIVNQSGTQPPAVSITYPTSNGKYNINVSAFNYTVSGDNVSNCWYSTNSGAANSSTVSPGINFTNVLSTEGSNTWIVYCNSSNLTGTNSVAFTKDTIFPNVTSNSPTDGYIDTVATSLSVTFNCSGADNLGLMNLSLYLTNSLNTSFVSNQTTSTNGTINSTAWTLNLIKGNYTWNCLASDSIGNFNWSTNRTVLLQTNSNPTITLNSPTNNSLLNKNGLVLLNATVNDADGSLNNLTVWFFGGYSNKTDVLINITYNQVPGTDVTFNWTGLNNTGKYNWTVIASDGKINSSNQFFYFERLNLTVTCEAGGNYQLGALVLIQGAVTNGTVILSSYPVNVSIYHINNSLNTFQNLTTANDGGYETSFSGLGVGSYALNASVSHLGYNETCKDTFSVGSAASFILDKVIAVHNITSTIINYNITLRATNKGGSDVASARLTDADSSDSPYSFDINANTTIQKNYLKSYTLNSSTYNSTLVIARVNATDAYSGTETAANSSLIILAIPASSTSEQLTLTKNAYYNSESSTKVNYTLSINVVNSGGTDLTAISIIDTDLSLNIVKNLNRTQNYTYSDSILIDKAASNTNKLFVQASATVNAVAYQSNQIQVRIPGYGGPADAIVNALASVTASASFDTPITVENKNTDIGQDFTIDYWITNQGETVNYTSGQQTIYVAASGNSDFTATLTAPSTAGTYRYKTVVTWAGGTATAYDTFTVAAAGGGGGGGGSGGGGGGGGTAAPITNIISKYYESAGSGSTVSVDAQRIDFAIIEVSFIVLDKQEKVTLSIEKIEDNSKVSEPLDHTYEYYSLEKTNVKDKDVSNAVIRFKVAKSWLELNNYDEKKVSLNRYSEKWVKLPTIMIEDTATHYFYEATTLGFSLFAITAEEKNAEGSEAMGEGITGKIVAEIVCNPPYIRYGKDCCLDQNNNLICDGDEIMVEGKAIEEKKELEKKSELVVGIKTLGSYLEGVILGIAKKANSISSSTVSKIFFWLALAVGIVMGIRKLKFWIGKKILRREDETDRHGFINRMLTKSFSHRRSDDEDEI